MKPGLSDNAAILIFFALLLFSVIIIRLIDKL